MISIIMPCYNVEKKIEKCLESYQNQTYRDFELIAIDDGSTDHTLSILKRYQKSDPRIKVYSQENAGPSKARNIGIDMAKGEYVVFSDSDDYVDNQYLEQLLNALRPESDIVIAGLNYVVKNKVRTVSGIRMSCSKDEFLEKYYAECVRRRLVFGPINKLYKREIIKKNGIHFDTRMKIREDGVFVFDYLQFCHTIEGIEDAGYYYIQNEVNESLISKLNENEQECNTRFYHAMISMKKNLSAEDIKAICPIFLNMEIAMIKKYYISEHPSYINGVKFIRSIHLNTEFREAREKLRRISVKGAIRYYCPVLTEAAVQKIKISRKRRN